MKLEDLYSILNQVLPNKVFYGTNVYDNGDYAEMPYIVYQTIGKRAIGHCDNTTIAFLISIQITLVTKKKNPTIEGLLEKILLEHDLTYEVTSEFCNSDKSINRIYQINMEEF